MERPSFDLVGVVLSSLGLAAALALVALVLGILWGVALIRRSRHHSPEPWGHGTLHLDLRA